MNGKTCQELVLEELTNELYLSPTEIIRRVDKSPRTIMYSLKKLVKNEEVRNIRNPYDMRYTLYYLKAREEEVKSLFRIYGINLV